MKPNYIISIFFLCLSALAGWLFWGPALRFGYSLIPASAEYGWVGKIIITVLVAYFGGLAVPFFLLILAVYAFANDF